MVFNSLEYLIFFPMVFIIYYLIPSNKYRNLFLLISSLYFYGSWMPKYLILILATIGITYITSILINKYENHKKIFLFLGIIINLIILIIFKYNDFFIENINRLFKLFNLSYVIENELNFLLPVGISFYTFQSIGYCIDVYRKHVKCEKNFVIYATFVTFFPQLVAGPIERSSNLIKQFYEKHSFKYEKGVEGLRYILEGMFRKVVIADTVAVLVNGVYNNLAGYSGLTLILSTILFSFQIYCDFSGYTLIAIGSGKILGFELMENFKSPYISKSFKEFWNTWHISLSTWFKDYIYIPLGGSKKGFFRKLINIFIIFAISGLWHGAAWTFIIWGVLHALYRIIEEIYIKYFNKPSIINLEENKKLLKNKNVIRYIEINKKELDKIKKYNNIINVLKILFTYLFVNIGWIFFRINSLSDVSIFFKNLFKNINLKISYRDFYNIIYNNLLNKELFVYFIFTIIFFSILYLLCQDILCKKYNLNIASFYEKLKKKRYIVYYVQTFLILTMYLILSATYGQSGQFIYFQF